MFRRRDPDVTKIAAIKGIDEAHVSGLAAIGITTLEVLL
jgi:hypothetical protein